ncbi:myb/SANT-like DNA-binding domain-containing protein 3 isoform X2 [Leptinotarsa decemlineata]|uniref:myb/SANT-like DNA-binding domain-containing protein 3 isoform X2 n=1 Tax=Leptinotarsa decemlineata TaxID=7539 RepID=UPI003D30C2C3
MEMLNKKVRSSNFSREEEMNLIQEIEKFKHILECKTTNKVTNAEKEEAWRKVLSSFNSRNIQVRSISQIKAKFDNLKTKARKDMAKQKSYMTGTGGGPAIKIDLDPVTEATLNIINMKTLDLGMDASSSVLKEELLKEYPQQFVDSEMTIIAAGEAKDEMSEISTQSIVPEFTEEIVLEENQISPPRSMTPSGSMSGKKVSFELCVVQL